MLMGNIVFHVARTQSAYNGWFSATINCTLFVKKKSNHRVHTRVSFFFLDRESRWVSDVSLSVGTAII